MIAPTQLRKPENWQDFEKLCKKLWGEIWNCPDSIKRNGRNGQNQHGVDVYGKPNEENYFYGIQCKGKDDYTNSKLTRAEIDNEIEKAKIFKPNLAKFIFATTANKDSDIEEYIRINDEENTNNGGFSIELYCWEDIVDLLEERRDTFNWYINNCQYKESSDIEIYVDWGKKIEINPEYIKNTKTYKKKVEIDLYKNPLWALNQKIATDYNSLRITTPNIGFHDILYPKSKIDYRWCTIPINIRNTGNTVIKDYKLYLVFEKDTIEGLDDKYRSFNPGPLIDQSIVAQENIDRRNRREVFESDEFSCVIEYHPLNPILVQDEHKTFTIGVKPKDGIDEILVQWIVKSRNYKKNGELVIKVIPKYEDKRISVEVENECDLKPDEVVIEPKIVEE
jgi:hypothetical protein